MTKEQAVRDSLPTRPANVIQSLGQEAERTFAGLFNGALRKGSIRRDALFIGKAECEWYWPQAWQTLKGAGLIDYSLKEEPNHPTIGGTTNYLTWSVTDLGWDVRNDDIKWFHELMDARDSDERGKHT